jgi:2'-5' RNA ligase
MAYYGVYFIPHLKERKRITPLRSRLCRKYKSNKALQYPVHATLSIGVSIRNPQAFMDDIKKFCSKQKPRTLHTKPNTDIIRIRRLNWCGIHFRNDQWLRRMMTQLKRISYKHTKERRPEYFNPHITLVYNTDLTGLKPMKTPVKRLKFDRITIVKKQTKNDSYRIYRHIGLGSRKVRS